MGDDTPTPPKRTVELPWTPEELRAKQQRDAWDRAGERIRAESAAQLEGMAQARQQRRRSSMRTLFELRGRTWVVRPLLGLALAGAAYALTRLFLH